jgi:hypothetical protein
MRKPKKKEQEQKEAQAQVQTESQAEENGNDKEEDIGLWVKVSRPKTEHTKLRREAAIYAVNPETNETFKFPSQLDAFEKRVTAEGGEPAFADFDYVVKARNPNYDELFTRAFCFYSKCKPACARYEESDKASFFDDVPYFFQLSSREEKALWIALSVMDFDISDKKDRIEANVSISTEKFDYFWARNFGSACLSLKCHCHELMQGSLEEIGRKLIKRHSLLPQLDGEFIKDIDRLAGRVAQFLHSETRKFKRDAPTTLDDVDYERALFGFDCHAWAFCALQSKGCELFDFEGYADSYLQGAHAKFAPDLSCLLCWHNTPIFVMDEDYSEWSPMYRDMGGELEEIDSGEGDADGSECKN